MKIGKCQVLLALLFCGSGFSNDKSDVSKVSSVYGGGRWSEKPFKGYRFILTRNFKLQTVDSSASGLFRVYNDTNIWRRQRSDESPTSLVFKMKSDRLVTAYVVVIDGVSTEEAQRDNFEKGFEKGEFKIESSSYGKDLINDKEFKTVFYVLNRGKGDIVSYNMFFSGKRKTVILSQTCPAAIHFKVYEKLMELASGLEFGDRI